MVRRQLECRLECNSSRPWRGPVMALMIELPSQLEMQTSKDLKRDLKRIEVMPRRLREVLLEKKWHDRCLAGPKSFGGRIYDNK